MTENTKYNGENAHTIFVGGKPFMNYVTAVVMQFTAKGAERVIVRSRGKFISRAVDIAEVVKNRFLKGQVLVGNIEIGSEEFTNKEGHLVNVSTLDVHLNKVNVDEVTISLQTPKSVQSTPKETPSETPTETPAETTEATETPTTEPSKVDESE